MKRSHWSKTPACLAALLSIGALPAIGQASKSQDRPPVRQPSQEYVIGPEDVLEIAVTNHSDLDKTVTVLVDGTISYAWAGRVTAAGKTPAQLAAELKATIETRRNNVVVTVSVKEIRSRRARIVGAVKSPGGYDIKKGWRLLDLVAQAGGLTARPARVTGRIVRSGGEVLTIDYARAIKEPSGDANPPLQSDDLILADETDPSANKVCILGQVAKPGAYPLGDEGVSVLSLLSEAGNFTEAAALSRAYVMRGSTEIKLDLLSLMDGKKPSDTVRTFMMQAGDVLFIPAIDKRIAVMGQVNKPGYYPLPETKPLTVLDALSLAGGQTQNGDLKRSGIIRMVDGKAQVRQLDIEKMLRTGELATNTTLQADDVLFLPNKGDRSFTWKDLINPFASLALLGFRLFTP